MFWIIFISFLAAMLLWILLGPVIIFLNTRDNRYYMALPGIFNAGVVPSEELFQIRGRVFFIPFKVDPFRKRTKRDRGQSFKLFEGMRLGRNILGSFRVRQLYLDIDTDDFILNAWLVPAFSAVNSENIHLQVNFEGNASLLLHIRTRLGALLWAVIKTKYQSLFNY